MNKNVKNNLDTYNITQILLLVSAVVQNMNHVDVTLVCCFLFSNTGKNVKFNVKHRECLRVHPRQRLMIKCLILIQIEMVFGNVGFWGEGSTRGKTSRSKGEKQQQAQPTYDALSGNPTRDTLVGGERSRNCTIPAPQCGNAFSEKLNKPLHDWLQKLSPLFHPIRSWTKTKRDSHAFSRVLGQLHVIT